jgi:exosortase family protein XrtF
MTNPKSILIQLFPTIKFIITGLFLYIIWILIYEGFIKSNHLIDPWLTNIVSFHSVHILKLAGFNSSHEMVNTGNVLFNNKIPVLRIAYICNGLILYVIFLIFMVSFPGPLKHKAWFIPLGLIIIYLSNLLRVVALVIIQIYAPDYLVFNHKYTFTMVIYGVIFLLWIIWVKMISVKSTPTS